jgi:DNA (cytosine-5)-methyltransferase 1
MSLSVGALCAGYGGLELGLSCAGFDFDLEWVAESDKWASVVLDKRFGVDNLGNITELTSVPPVDVIVAGFPCQPVSSGGKRRGVDDERWLIEDVVRIAELAGARWLLLENVLGIYTANEGEAFGQVLASLAKGGFDAKWRSVRADKSCGAPHKRNRWFCVAFRGDNGESLEESKSELIGELNWIFDETEDFANSDGSSSDEERRGGRRGLSGTSKASEIEGKERKRIRAVSTDGDQTSSDPDLPSGKARSDEGLDGELSREESLGSPSSSTGELILDDRWGDYGSAIALWENQLLREAPEALVNLDNKGDRLSCDFVEWMMGLPSGWVTGDDVNVPRTQQLKMLGNGVVPQQAAVAFLSLLGVVHCE